MSGSTVISPPIPHTPTTPPSTASPPITPCAAVARRSSRGQPHADTDSGKSSSCSPALLDCSFDSGISVEASNLQLHKRIQQCKRILNALERDKDSYRELREKLRKIVDKKNSKKPEKTEEEQFCNVCCGGISIQDAKTFVTCCTCNKRICRDGKCADWLPKTAQWECRLCSPSKGSLAQTSSWVAEQMSFNEQKFVYPMRARSEIYIPISDCNDSSMQFESVSQIDVNSAAISAEQKLKIRKYVEEVVADILGASLDQVPVGQLSKSESYLPAVINGDNATTTTATTANNNNNDSHSDLNHISQTRLRQLIQAIIAETVRTPALSVNGDLGPTLDTHASLDQLPLTNGNGQRHRTEQYFKPQYYQDLLATAVLNKIVDKEGNEVHLCASTPDLRAHNIDANFNVENQSTTSGSSVEPKSDCSFNINKDENLSLSGSESERQQLVDDAELIGRESGLSDYIASHMVPLPDLSAPPTESEEDDYISVTSSAIGDGTWQKNWLFKKKRSTIEATATASSVGMLVPAPKEDVRAQIGDKTTDEVSDLSEMGSDTDESSLDLLRGNSDPLFNDRLLNKHLIGGHNTKMVLDELIDRTSLISNSSLPENAPAFTETKNEHVVDNATKTEAINTNVSKLLTPNVDIDVVSPPIPFKDINVITEEDDSNPLSGSIAERECMKWYNAVDMPNNPYSAEALKRRISGSQEKFMDLPNISPSTEQNPIALIPHTEDDVEEESRENDYKRYSRDYYINGDKQTASSPKRLSMSDTTATKTSNNNDEPIMDMVINEVIIHGNHKSSCNSPINNSDCHWTLSTPVRRNSSLKFTNNSHIRKSQYSHTTIAPISNAQPTKEPQTKLLGSSSSSTSRYANNDDDDVGDAENCYGNNIDTRSHRSWQNFTSATPCTPSKPRVNSAQGFYDVSTGFGYRKRSSVISASALIQFEKQLLHKDLKRNSFRAISATTKDFVMNPLYDRHQFYGNDGRTNLSPKSDIDDQVDSGIDSCLNGFSEPDVKFSNNSLLF